MTVQEKWEGREEPQRIKTCVKFGEQLRSLRSILSPGYSSRGIHQSYNKTASLLTMRCKESLGRYETYGDMATAFADATQFKAAIGNAQLEH